MPSTPEYQHLRLERDASLLWVSVNRAQVRNALSRATLEELGRAFATHASDATLKVAVLTGEGDKAFVAGGDLKDLLHVRTVEETAAFFDRACAALERLRRFPVPVVAALNGMAVGGGAELALACDFRVAASTASIGYVQARLGITSGFGGGADLMRLIGPSKALLHMLRAEVLNVSQARALGLVDEIAAEGEPLDVCVRHFIAPILHQPVQVIRAYKALAIALRCGASRSEAQAIERAGFVATWTHADHWSALEQLLDRSEKESQT